MSSSKIYLSVPHMSGHERAFVDDAFESNWLSSVGPNLDAFESEIAVTLGGDVSTLAVSSGTAALHLILRSLGVGAGDSVAVSTFTFAGSVFPILYQGATPVFLESERDSWNLDPQVVRDYLAAAAKRDRLPKALVVVHLYGQHADLDPILESCQQYGVTLIEDAAESLGGTYRERQTATTADFGVLSFNGNKIITTTGGGMVIARDRSAIDRMRKWATQAREPAVEYVHREVGYNYRLSNVLAGIGRGQLMVLADRVRARRAVADRYQHFFRDVPGLCLQPEVPWGQHTRWLTAVTLDRGILSVTPDEIVRKLGECNIETRPVWRPMHTQPMFADAEHWGGNVSESIFECGVCLPSSSSLTVDDQKRVADAIVKVVH